VAPAGDPRARAVKLAQELKGHEFGEPLVFGDRIYLPDYSTGKVLRTTPDGRLETFPQNLVTPSGGGTFELFVDDGQVAILRANLIFLQP
jgi:hypothetical protein